MNFGGTQTLCSACHLVATKQMLVELNDTSHRRGTGM